MTVLDTTALERHGDVHVLRLGDDENRFSPERLGKLHEALDVVEADPVPLVTVGSGKFYSNGLDLEWIVGHRDELSAYAADVQELLARVLTLPVPTVAAVNGHAFAAGAMLALAHDWRVMREDRGFFCLPEVDIRIPFTAGMSALIQAKLTPATAVTAMTTGHRYGGGEALAAGLVDATAAEPDVLSAAVAHAAGLVGKDPATLGTIKRTMYADAAARLREPAVPGIPLS